MNDNRAALRQAIEAFTSGEVGALHDLFTDDVRGWSPTTLTNGLPELVAAVKDIDTALSDVEVHIDALDTFGNKGVAEYRLTGRFTGSFAVDDDAVIEPNGQMVLLGGAIVAEFDGTKIRAFRNYFDELALLEQMLAPA